MAADVGSDYGFDLKLRRQRQVAESPLVVHVRAAIGGKNQRPWVGGY